MNCFEDMFLKGKKSDRSNLRKTCCLGGSRHIELHRRHAWGPQWCCLWISRMLHYLWLPPVCSKTGSCSCLPEWEVRVYTAPYNLRVHSHLSPFHSRIITWLRLPLGSRMGWAHVFVIAIPIRPIEKNHNRNRNRVINLRCEWTIKPQKRFLHT